jgi:class 3 adenylate cyclase
MDFSKHQNDINLKTSEKQNGSISSADELIKRVEELDEELQKRLTKEITILFTDIKGSTTFFKTHGDIAGRLMMQRHYDMLSPIITQHEGTIVKTVGDSIMASFDEPYKAVKAAMEMQRTLSEYNANLPKEDLIRIRIGINFGKGIIEGNDVYGNVVNEASKLVSIGESEQIVVSESIYEKLQSIEDVTFFPLETDKLPDSNLELRIYAVRWQEADQVREKEITTMSLALMNYTSPINKEVGSEEESKPLKYFSPVEDVIREKAFRTSVGPEWRLQAIFENAETSVETALEALKILQKSDQEFHIGIHTGPVLIEEVETHGGEEANEAREKADSGEIYITQPTYESIKDNPLLKFLPLPICLKNGISLYRILWEPTEKRKVQELHLIDQKFLYPECFYCSSRNHHSSLCPSKNIPFHTHSLNEIGYLSSTEIKALFATHFPNILKPCKADQDEILVPLIPDHKSDSFKLPFEAFYEANEVFQLRFLREVWRSEATNWNNFALSPSNRRGGGFLWLGEDSLRVSKHNEAYTMLNKALEHNTNDYKPYVALGFLAVETDDLAKAAYQFRRALLCTSNPLQKSYVLLLISRIAELRNNLEDAVDKVREALIIAPHFLEAKYRHALLLAKRGDKNEALSILRNLIATEPNFYIKVLVDPGLDPIRSDIDLLIKEFFEHAKAQALNSIKTIKKNLIDHGEWFSKEDPEYKSAEKIFNQTLKLSEGNSYFAFLDVVGYGFNIKDKLRSALRNRRRSIRKSINSFHAVWEEYNYYLKQYYYKSLISYRDAFLADHYSVTLNRAKAASSIESAESLKEAQNFINELSSLSRKIANNQKKLNFLKMIYFALECSSKFFARFVLWFLFVSLVSCFILIGYQAYSQSVYDFSTKTIADYLKFSSFFGAAFGAGASVHWIYKNFDRLYSRLK